MAHALVQQDVSEATRETQLSARAAVTRRVYVTQVRAFGTGLLDVVPVTPVDVADYLAGPGAQRSHRWHYQAAVMAAIEATATKPGIGCGCALESGAQSRSSGQLDIALLRVLRDAFPHRSEVEARERANTTVESDGSERLVLSMPAKVYQEVAGPRAHITRTTVDAPLRL